MDYEYNRNSILKERKEYVDCETGQIRNDYGIITGYVDFSNNEQTIIHREVNGNIEYTNISSSSMDSEENEYDKYEDWKNWRYWEIVQEETND